MAMLLWLIRLRQTIAVPKLGDLPMKRLTQGMHGLTGLAMAAIQGLKGCRALDTGLVLAIEGVDRAQLFAMDPSQSRTKNHRRSHKSAKDGESNHQHGQSPCLMYDRTIWKCDYLQPMAKIAEPALSHIWSSIGKLGSQLSHITRKGCQGNPKGCPSSFSAPWQPKRQS